MGYTGVAIGGAGRLAWMLAAGPWRSVVVVALLLVTLPRAAAVCPHCFDQLEGCTGGATCPFIVGTAANTAAMVAGTATAAFSVTQLLPRSYVAVCTRTVLDTLMARVRRPVPGATPDIRGWDLPRLMNAFKDHSVPRHEIIAEMTSLIPGADQDQQGMLKLALDAMKMYKDTDHGGSKTTSDTQGLLLLLWALAGRIVLRGSATVVVSVENAASESTAARISEKQTRPASAIAFCERMSVFTSLSHALGVCHVLAATNFFRVVAWDTMLRDKLSWQVAHELVLVYFEDIDNSTTKTLGNIVESGGQDSRLARAKTNAIEYFKQDPLRDIFRESGDGEEGRSKTLKFNGKDSPAATQCCASHNLGNTHPVKSLFSPSGKCRYFHGCDRYVADDGKQCRSKEHVRKDCDHPDARPISFKPTRA
jgi:hypothetical protein